MAMNRTRIGSVVRARRKARGWTQQRLADAAHLSLRTITNVEAGKHVDDATLVDVCQVLDIDPDTLEGTTRTLEDVWMQYPPDVQVLLNVLGGWLMALPPARREYEIQRLTGHIFGPNSQRT